MRIGRLRDDEGTTLMELMVGMLIMTLFMAMFTTAVVLMNRAGQDRVGHQHIDKAGPGVPRTSTRRSATRGHQPARARVRRPGTGTSSYAPRTPAPRSARSCGWPSRRRPNCSGAAGRVTSAAAANCPRGCRWHPGSRTAARRPASAEPPFVRHAPPDASPPTSSSSPSRWCQSPARRATAPRRTTSFTFTAINSTYAAADGRRSARRPAAHESRSLARQCAAELERRYERG